MDATDGKILMQLQRNAKQNTKEIAAKVGLSVTPTYERIRKLEQQEIIRSYITIPSPKIYHNQTIILLFQFTLIPLNSS